MDKVEIMILTISVAPVHLYLSIRLRIRCTEVEDRSPRYLMLEGIFQKKHL